MVQDWGYNYIYLRHECAITSVKMKNHTYQDVTHMLMEEFDSGSLKHSSEESKEVEDSNVWLCGASTNSRQIDEPNGARK